PFLSGFVGTRTPYHFPIFTANELILTISVIYHCAKFCQNPFIIATFRVRTDTHRERARERRQSEQKLAQTRLMIVYSVPCYCILMGQIIIIFLSTTGSCEEKE